MAPIALLTDFGPQDWFAGTLKGVIAGIAPEAPVLDLGHGIAPGDVRGGAFSLWAAFRYFPAGTIFVAVVDPGVGGPRDGLLVSAHGRHFIGPDNGLLSWATAGDPGRIIRVLGNPRFRLEPLSGSFHGRDAFAPAAAHLHRGSKPGSFGKRKSSLVELPPISSSYANGRLSGEILHVDRFGNAITSIFGEDLAALPGKPLGARVRRQAFPLRKYYTEAGPGKPLSLVGSTGLVELALNGGHAAETYGLRTGMKLTFR